MKNFSDHLLAHRQQNYCFPFRFSNDSPQVFQWQKIMDNLNISRFPTKSQQQMMKKANFRVKWRAGKGRCLVASRDINPLELIMFDAAIVTGPQVSRSSSLLAPQSDALSRLAYMSNSNFKRVSPQLSVRRTKSSCAPEGPQTSSLTDMISHIIIMFITQAVSLPVCLECASPLTSESKYWCRLLSFLYFLYFSKYRWVKILLRTL